MSKDEALDEILYITRMKQAAKKEPVRKPSKKTEVISYYKNERTYCSYRKK